LEELFSLIQETPAHQLAKFDASLARGLSYYTGPIFEATHPKLSGSIAGGGRYDDLVGIFLGRTIPAVGFTLGLDRLELVMEDLGIFPDMDAGVDALIAFMGDAVASVGLAADLRNQGLRIDVFPEPAKMKAQFKYADAIGARHLLLVGPDELVAGKVTVKNLATREQTTLPRGAVAEHIRSL
jgi:histidyl-tRNA synthetase